MIGRIRPDTARKTTTMTKAAVSTKNTRVQRWREWGREHPPRHQRKYR